MGCAVFHEEDEADEDLQTGIEVGAECVETRGRGPGATGASRSSLSSECSLLHVASLALLSGYPALFDPDSSKKP
jgi:hypothetical protein